MITTQELIECLKGMTAQERSDLFAAFGGTQTTTYQYPVMDYPNPNVPTYCAPAPPPPSRLWPVRIGGKIIWPSTANSPASP